MFEFVGYAALTKSCVVVTLFQEELFNFIKYVFSPCEDEPFFIFVGYSFVRVDCNNLALFVFCFPFFFHSVFNISDDLGCHEVVGFRYSVGFIEYDRSARIRLKCINISTSPFENSLVIIPSNVGSFTFRYEICDNLPLNER